MELQPCKIDFREGVTFCSNLEGIAGPESHCSPYKYLFIVYNSKTTLILTASVCEDEVGMNRWATHIPAEVDTDSVGIVPLVSTYSAI